MASKNVLIPFILSFEGGFVNDPRDLGGATNKGITLATFRHFFGAGKTVSDLKAMTGQQWSLVFERGYWDKWRASEIKDQSVANLLVDWIWASGAYGVKIPQSVLKVSVDGIVGQKTVAALNSQDPKNLFDKLKQERIDFIERICKTRPANRRFKAGWLRRINNIGYGYLRHNNGRVERF